MVNLNLLKALAAVSCMVALAYVTRYSGMDIVIGLTVTSTGGSIPSLERCSAGSGWC